MSQISCIHDFQSAFYENANLIGDCYNKCPIECTRFSYDLSLSSSSYPTLWYSKVLTNNSKFNTLINAYFEEKNVSFINYTDNFLELKNSIARVNVYYEDLRFTKIDDNPAMNFVTLLGTLGGNLGLFLGKLILFYSYSTVLLVIKQFYFQKGLHFYHSRKFSSCSTNCLKNLSSFFFQEKINL
jgi:hypothetical protein